MENEQPDSREKGMSAYFVFCAFSALLAGFNAGYNGGASNTTENIILHCPPAVEDEMGDFPDCLPMSSLVWGFAVGVFALGGLTGSTIAGSATSKFGRKTTLFWNNLAFIAGGLMIALSVNIPLFIAGRFLVGVGSGVAGVAVATYLAEISTDRWRGPLGITLELSQMGGILISQGLGIPFATVPGWRWLMGGTLAPAILQMILLPFCQETPRFLIMREKYDEARESLVKLRRGCQVDLEYDDMIRAQKESGSNGNTIATVGSSMRLSIVDVARPPVELGETKVAAPLNIFEILKNRKLRKMALVGITLFALQPLSGMIGIVYYSTSIFEKVFGAAKAAYVTLGIASINFLLTFVSAVVIEKAGRKLLLVISEIGMLVASALLVVGSTLALDPLVITAAFLFVAAFAIGLGPVTVILIPELMPTKAISAVISMANNVGWICTFAVGLLLPVLTENLKTYTFTLFIGTNLLALLFTLIFVPSKRK
ncbi:monosaccharide transporter [Basidiobolus meristosporus CBS 931.73]|uniref:Monosaccharide transporter n=1 Tax=Basidiobolus meristosporus CBS 931.73 TaxID=1314790 RepID=A0A1Y1YVZ9_9FUNG|nr:monosaccharide transporter [Basidiobolus meristosporus CBS 931.73]|eukprot:ORY02228.1 monosaccharide transporter [Basidiobolus meristosporus CBS 931.73]